MHHMAVFAQGEVTCTGVRRRTYIVHMIVHKFCVQSVQTAYA